MDTMSIRRIVADWRRAAGEDFIGEGAKAHAQMVGTPVRLTNGKVAAPETPFVFFAGGYRELAGDIHRKLLRMKARGAPPSEIDFLTVGAVSANDSSVLSPDIRIGVAASSNT